MEEWKPVFEGETNTPARRAVGVSALCDITKGLLVKLRDLMHTMLNSYKLPPNLDKVIMMDQIGTNLSALQSYDQGLVKAGGGGVNRSARCLCNEGLVASQQLLAQRHHFVTLHKLRGKRETDKSGNIPSPSKPKKETKKTNKKNPRCN